MILVNRVIVWVCVRRGVVLFRISSSGLEEMVQPDMCCGFGGATSLEHPEVADKLMEKKLE